MRYATRLALLTGASILLVAAPATAQLGALVSPGALARAHASLEGLANCEKCHERGRRVTPAKCLSCHAPIAERIRSARGVHRNAGRDCVACHVDHAGLDAELRPFDTARFDHAVETGFALDGRHAPVAAKCAACHATRSFLTAKPACASCHKDPHAGWLGTTCQRCHSTAATFTSARTSFDHARTPFPLTGAHQTTACAACHPATPGRPPTYKVANASSCATCHRTPHKAEVSSTCRTCHSTDTWRTSKFDHTKTAFPLVGRHQSVACAACHKGPAARSSPAFATCASCHSDPHRGTFKQDCAACHSETSFRSATAFDHASTGFALADRHAGLACAACHKATAPARASPLPRPPAARAPARGAPVVPAVSAAALDFRGLQPACASCHADPHRGELGASCAVCHTARTFAVDTFTHPGSQALYAGAHAPLACAACHKPSGASPSAPRQFKGTPTSCASCHRDVHLGQVGPDCASCHAVTSPKFAATGFAHDRARFALTGAHQRVPCAKCHPTESRAYPAGAGSAMRLSGIATTCVSCHADVHLGQVGLSCEQCHSSAAFTIRDYRHVNPPRDFFVGRHLNLACARCHQPRTGRFPAGQGTALDLRVDAGCVACHTDVHRGALGSDCAACHKPEPLRPSHRPAAVPVLPGVRP